MHGLMRGGSNGIHLRNNAIYLRRRSPGAVLSSGVSWLVSLSGCWYRGPGRFSWFPLADGPARDSRVGTVRPFRLPALHNTDEHMVRDVTDQPRLCQEQTLEMPAEGLHRIAEVHLQLLSHGSLLAGLQQTLAMIREQPGHGNQHEVGEQLLLYLTPSSSLSHRLPGL